MLCWSRRHVTGYGVVSEWLSYAVAVLYCAVLDCSMFCVTDLMPCDCRSLSQLVEVGPVKAAAYPMARVASHMLERHGPGLQRAPSHMLECSKQDRNCATSSMAQVSAVCAGGLCLCGVSVDSDQLSVLGLFL